MRGKPQGQHGAHFEVPSQSAGAINNVGGDLHVGGLRRRSASIGRAVAALGLALFFAGMLLLGTAGLDVYRQTDGLADTTSIVVPAYAVSAGALVVAGFILNRFGRLFAGH